MPRSTSSAVKPVSPYANDGVFGEFSRHRQFNSPISRELMLDTDTRDIGQKIANCALTLKANVIVHPELPPETNLTAARVCNTRLCPFCEWRRTRVWRKRLYGGLGRLLDEQPKLSGVFLTLTVKNVPLEHLGDQLDEMNAAWHRMKNRAFFPTSYWFRRTEVTVGYPPGMAQAFAHPHFHVLLLVKPSYFSHGYVKQTEWQKQWMTAGKLDYAPVVDVRRASQKTGTGSDSAASARSAVLEAAKYAAKATELMELGADIRELHWQLRNRRLYALSSDLRRYIKDGEIEESEMLDNDAKPLPVGAEQIEVMARWFEDTSEYLITDLAP